ncbi:MAG: rod shape-determining protein [Firmicutes bacterium]|nr:rod shape-determining protein [Bacillota bacterium]
MATIEIAIDLGTSNTSIFAFSQGIVLQEPTMIAFVGGERQKVLSVGHEAAELLGKTPKNVVLSSPVSGGLVVDTESAAVLLRLFIARLIPNSFFPPKVKVIASVPVGLDPCERRSLEEIILSASKCVKEVTLVSNIILSALGANLPIENAAGGLVANIGGGTSEIGAMSVCGIINAHGLLIGGDILDKAVMKFVTNRYHLEFGIASAKRLREEMGTLFENDKTTRTVHGVDKKTATMTSAVITASDLYEVLNPYYMRIADEIEDILSKCPSDASSEYNRTGVHIAGGAAKISGLKEAFQNRLGLPVYISENPQNSAILGAGKLLSNKQLLQKILAQN